MQGADLHAAIPWVMIFGRKSNQLYESLVLPR